MTPDAAKLSESAGETTGALRGTGGGRPADSAPASAATQRECEHDWRLANEEKRIGKQHTGHLYQHGWTRRWYCTRCRKVEERYDPV